MRLRLSVLVFAAAIAVGCGDDSNNTGGAGGSAGESGPGGTGGVGATGGTSGTGGGEPVNACLGDADLLMELADTVVDTATTCTLGNCILIADLTGCVSDCVESETGLSADCSRCFGLVSDCVVNSCSGACGMNPDSEGCEACQEDSGCNQVFVDCAGFDPDDFGTGGAGGSAGVGGSAGAGGGGSQPPTITMVEWEPEVGCAFSVSSEWTFTVTATDPDTDSSMLILDASASGCSPATIDGDTATVTCPNAAQYTGTVSVEDPENNFDIQMFLFGGGLGTACMAGSQTF